MALYTNLASLSQTAASNAADGSVDAPATVDNQLNLLASFIAQLRDGNGFSTGVGNAGDCRLSVSAGNIVMLPYKGNGLTINGVVQKIPSFGIGLAPTALTPGTVYFIYAAWSGSAIVLEASTTGHTTDASTGVEVKTGDGTRTLVGMARPTTGPTFTDSVTQRLVINWFNPSPVYLRIALGSNVPTASLSPVAISGPVEFLTWAGRGYQFNVVGGSNNSSSTALNYTYLALNGTAPATAAAVGQAASAGGYMPACLGATLPFAADGYNAVYCVGQVTAGTGTWLAGLEITGQVLA